MALDYLPSTGWAVIYGETPSATRWSELGENDDSLATGAGIDDLAILRRHINAAAVDVSKVDLATWPAFLASASGSQNIIGGAAAVPFVANTEIFDNTNNYNNGSYIFTVPAGGGGVYEFFLFVTGSNPTSSRLIPQIKIGATTYNGTQQTDTYSSGFCHLKIKLNAGNTVQPMVSANPANIPTNTGVLNCRWSGSRVA